MVLMIEIGISKGYEVLVYCMAGLQFAYLLAILIGRPYKRAIDNIGIIILETATFMALTIPIATTLVNLQ